ncbi:MULTISPECIES: DUF1302 domain-containing protein [unclassified Pseudomonas]|uniref:DUF1302 domain-containing protein n=1 Tax=unclassified Pseudomonas TaxID=196821 RepID=UPI00244CC1F4|nr:MULTISPECIES: DUF1302 domain-containing protein [unclassified Pseudomonas]MDG9926257.1 DUF1302 domain-containing protein [Pseudomonas sp. GD04045]MDH0036475.1 DUF1302 domain-containing protein [Pseudomonas sp. GD04019]
MAIPLRKSSLCLAPAKAGFALAGLIPLLLAVPASAVEFSFVDGEVTGSLDTTLSYGQLYRVQGQDKTNDDTNGNDGNRNFDTGLVSEVFKITSDLEANYQNYGMFVRGTAFYDTQIMDKRNDNDDFRPSQSYPNNDHFTDETRRNAGNSAEILDAYVYGNWDVGTMPLTVKVGRQVFNWGEGIFYRGGINTTNPIDAAKFRLPGSELKEVLVPVEAFNFNIGLTDNLSLESFYQWNWKESAIDPAGTFFSETDLFAEGGNTAYTRYDNPLLPVVMSGYQSALGAGLVGNGPFGPNAYLDPQYNVFKVANVGSDINAKNDGQYGFALRYVAEELNLTEFGFYYINYHAKEPQIAVDLSHYEGVDLDAISAALGPFGPALSPAVATLDAASNAVARREYVEDIRVYGFSFNTTIGEASVFGEIAYRPNLPVGISATNDLLGDLLGQGFFGQTNIYDGNVAGDQACADISGKQLCRGPMFHNYERIEAFNLSLGTIYNFGPAISFDSLMGVAEIASEHARASSLTYTAYDGSRRGFAGRPNGAYVSDYDDEDQISRDAYGYTLALSGTWNDVYAGVNLSPFGVFKHNFQGNSHQTGNFVEGAMAYSVGLRASYLNSLEAEVQYTEYYGGGQNNSGRDRDNLGVNLKYSF